MSQSQHVFNAFSKESGDQQHAITLHGVGLFLFLLGMSINRSDLYIMPSFRNDDEQKKLAGQREDLTASRTTGQL